VVLSIFSQSHSVRKKRKKPNQKNTALLVKESVDRVGQRTTEHNRSSSPPGSRRLTGYNGVAKAKGWKISLLADK
jgi:hypothetical protein